MLSSALSLKLYASRRELGDSKPLPDASYNRNSFNETQASWSLLDKKKEEEKNEFPVMQQKYKKHVWTNKIKRTINVYGTKEKTKL